MKNPQRGFVSLLVVIIVGAIAIGGTYYVLQDTRAYQFEVNNKQAITTPVTLVRQPAATTTKLATESPAPSVQGNLKVTLNSNAQIKSASLLCPENIQTVHVPNWYGVNSNWCKTKATGPFNADSTGKTVLWFTVSPKPAFAEINKYQGPLSAPKVSITFQDGTSRIFVPQIISPDRWEIGE